MSTSVTSVKTSANAFPLIQLIVTMRVVPMRKLHIQRLLGAFNVAL
jgi:hypothetical protein